MAWDHLSITKPHLVYIILGGFTSLFMLCSSIIKERMYIGEATVATICGLIFGPHAADLINPLSWGNTDTITIEFSRIVLVVQCFAVGVELPKFYMERHWKSVVFLLVPVMTFGWLVTSLFVWWMVPPINWLESLVIAACVTATDPVLASSVVGKGKFAKRVPKHLRDLLSAESGCNDGMAFPFIYLSLYLIQDKQSAREVSYHWIVYTILYECIFGAVYGFLIGYIARHGIKFAERRDLIDRESFLVFYFVLALFCAGSGSILGVDDLLVGFSAGVGFSNDGWFGHKTEESHVSNVIDLLLNLAYFVYLGTIIPWEMYNNASIGLSAWRLTIIAIFVILFRRIPIMLALKPLIPDIKTWREALFAGHFGPIGVGAIFVAILARAELEHDSPVPLSELPSPDVENYTLIVLVWPVVTFLVISSIIVHGSSIAVFTLGKRINTLTVTMSYTTAPEDGPSWMNRLPRISSQSRSQARTMSDTDMDELKLEMPPGVLLPVGIPGNFLRRMKEEDGPSKQGSRASSIVSRRRRKKWDDGIGPGGPISQSAIFPQRRTQGQESAGTPQAEASSGQNSQTDTRDETNPNPTPTRPSSTVLDTHEQEGKRTREHSSDEAESSSPTSHPKIEVYEEGDKAVLETEQGEVLGVAHMASSSLSSPGGQENSGGVDLKDLGEKLKQHAAKPDSSAAGAENSGWTYGAIKKKLGNWKNEEAEKRKEKQIETRKHEPARAYQIGNTIIVEDEDGEVVKKYDLPSQKGDKDGNDVVAQSLKYMGMGGLIKAVEKPKEQTGKEAPEDDDSTAVTRVPSKPTGVSSWIGFGRTAGEPSSQKQKKKDVVAEKEEEDDRHIRFTIGGIGRRMTKDGFLEEMKKLDQNTRQDVIDKSTASNTVKTMAKQESMPSAAGASSAHESGKKVSATTGSSRRAEHREESSSDNSLRKHSSGPQHKAAAESERGRKTHVDTGDDNDIPETAVERRRRLAALGVEDDSGESSGEGSDEDRDDDAKETPAERRRREAALGMSSQPADDSDDDDTPRVPPARRGIRFADVPGKKRN